MWQEDEDYSPTVEFKVQVKSDRGYPLFMKGTFNSLIPAITMELVLEILTNIDGLKHLKTNTPMSRATLLHQPMIQCKSGTSSAEKLRFNTMGICFLRHQLKETYFHEHFICQSEFNLRIDQQWPRPNA